MARYCDDTTRERGAERIEVDASAAVAAARANPRPGQAGVHVAVAESFEGGELEWVRGEDGGRFTAAVVIASRGAVRLRTRIVGSFPARSVLTVHGASESATETLERQTQRDESARWLASTDGDEQTIQISVASEADTEHVALSVLKVSHRYIDGATAPQTSTVRAKARSTSSWPRPDSTVTGECPRDLACERAADVLAVRNSVVLIVGENAYHGFACSGTLINSLATEDPQGADKQRPAAFVLTAAHCIEDATTAESVETVWFARHARCNGEAYEARHETRTGGADTKARASLIRMPVAAMRPNM